MNEIEYSSFAIGLYELDTENPENLFIGEKVGYFDIDNNCEITISDNPTKFCASYLLLWIRELTEFCKERKLLLIPDTKNGNEIY
jgi:hypothetical protein